MSEQKKAGTPVGSKGLTQVGSPNRIQKRPGQAPETPNFGISSFMQEDAFQTPKKASRHSDSFQTPTALASAAAAAAAAKASSPDIFQTPMTSAGQPRSGFAERVYQSTSGKKGFIGSGSSSLFRMSSSDSPGAQRDAPFVPRLSLLDELSQSSSGDLESSLHQTQRQDDSLKAATEQPLKSRPVSNSSSSSSSSMAQRSESAIPKTVVDIPSQRMYALSAFVLLVAWKLFDAVNLTVSDSAQTSMLLFAKWSLLDTAMWYAAWKLHIPKLVVSLKGMYLLIFACLFIDLNLFLLPSSLFVLAFKPMAVGIASSCMRSIKSIPWLGPRLVGDSDLLIDSFVLDDEHILGRHTIHVLPHSLAHMNPQGKSFCIDSHRQNDVPWYKRISSSLLSSQGSLLHRKDRASIPVLVNGTRPASISYAFTSFETGEKQIRTVANIGALRKDIGAVYPSLGNWVMATYYLPISEVGAYEIYSVKDSKGLEFRTATHAPPAIVVSCPTAHLQWRTGTALEDNFAIGSDGHASICQRLDLDDNGIKMATSNGFMEVVVEGYEPVDMTIVRLVRGHREVIGLDGVQPRITELPADTSPINGNSDNDIAVDDAKRAQIERWSRYRTRRSVYTLSDAFVRPGKYIYKLESIRDAANHTVILGDALSTSGHGKHGPGASVNNIDSSISNSGLFDSEKFVVGTATPYMASIQVYSRPIVGWEALLLNNGELPLRLSDDMQRKSQYTLPLKVSGDGPWTVEYGIVDGAETIRESKTFANAKDAVIEANRPGIYHLVAVKDTHCSGVAERANVTLVKTPKPAVNVTSTPITAHECGGEIGAQIDLELAGRPPFAIHYRERNLDIPGSRPIARVVRTHQQRYSFRVIPELAGTYEFEFFTLEDDNYPSGQPVSAVIRQAIHAQPSVQLDTTGGYIPPVICLGDSIELPLKFKGQGPWQLTYNIVHENRRKTLVVEGIKDARHTIDLGSFDSPGQYSVELAQIKDKNQCARDLLEVVATVKVREGGPRVGFQCPDGGIRILDGQQARMPVQISGDLPVEISYRRIDDTHNIILTANLGQKSRNRSKDSYIAANGPGEYELVSACDICAGTVDPVASRCAVKVEPKPRAWFTTSGLKYNEALSNGQTRAWQLASNCEGSSLPRAFELGLSGSGPWQLEYRVDYWSWDNGNSGNPRFVDRTALHTSVAMQYSTLKNECCDAGLYRYTLTGVSDERYQQLQRLAPSYSGSIADKDLTVVEHRIMRSPNAELRAYMPDGKPMDVSMRGTFLRKQPVIKHCLAPGQSRSDGDAQTWASIRDKLPVFRVEFDKDGVAPFQAWVEVFPASGPNEVVEIKDIKGFSQIISLPGHIASQIGRYHMRLFKVRDSRGCERQLVDPSKVGLSRSADKTGSKAIAGGIEIEYIEAPSAQPASSSPAANPSRNVCLGDILAFDLHGLNSWNLEYFYNGAHRTTSANKRLFRRIADEPGNFTLTRICHRSANDCCSNVKDLSYTVHDIPRVRVSGGKDAYQDIIEGDMVDIRLDLVGTPPFTFTWQRRSLAADGAGSAGGGKVLESHTVKDFDGFSYIISTSSEGTFEVTFIRDQFCQYPKA
ncbi:hypothetical protein J3B02_001426 [Coemansia erecta]|nr:hypothetical protein J3B02_001426 [Coemansia erecta]